MTMSVIITALLSSVFLNNITIKHFGEVNVNKKQTMKETLIISIITAIIIIIASAISFGIFKLALQEVVYLAIISNIVITVLLVFATKVIVEKVLKLTISLPDFSILMILTVVLAATQIASQLNESYGKTMINSVGFGIGYVFMSVALKAIDRRLQRTNIPEAVKGIPIMLITCALIALTFLGLQGL